MAYFADASEVYKYLGGAFRTANETAGVGENLRAITVVLKEPRIEVVDGTVYVKQSSVGG